ncbi:MAG TPA: hypothetical protein VIM73_09845 [Polyangiaceae bacterium]
MGCLPFVARRYVDIAQRFGVRRQACDVGRVTLVATNAFSGADTLASLSELALAAVYTSVARAEQESLPTMLRIGLVVVQAVWSGPIEATACAHSAGRGWLLDCELRDEQGRLLSTALAHAPA